MADEQWFYAATNPDGVRILQPVTVLSWDGSVGLVITTQKADGKRALGVGRPTRVETSKLFHGKANIVYDE